MKKEYLSNPLVIVSAFLFIVLVGVLIKVYFVDAVINSYEKKEVYLEDKQELERLTKAYLIQNPNLKLNKYFSTPTSDNRFNVAAEYYYLKNGQENLNDYEEILDVAKKIFNVDQMNFSNFEINIDENQCGKEKYTTINGIVHNEECDYNEIVFEINDIYESNNEYVVEFYATKALEEQISPINKCTDFQIALSYNLTLSDLLNQEIYNENNSLCCEENCELGGIYPLRNEIMIHAKKNDLIYKMIFSKNEYGFVFESIKK